MRHVLLATAVALLVLPAFLDADVADAGDPQVKAKTRKLSPREHARVELGRRLFFDPAASPSGARSCASCHSPDHGWSDPSRVSADDVGDTRRHSQPLLDAAYHANAHWDGEFSSVEHLVVARLGTDPRGRTPGSGYGGHMPFPPRGPVTRRSKRPAPPTPVTPGERRPLLKTVPVPPQASVLVPIRLVQSGRYAGAFKAAFGKKDINLGTIAQAIAAFTHSIESTTAPIDRYLAGNLDALSASAKRGLALFNGRAGCNQCHTSEGERPFFTDFAFHNTGVSHHQLTTIPMDGDTEEALRLRIMRKALQGKDDDLRAHLLDMSDQGRGTHTGKSADKRTFKTPTLRDVAKRGPFMHNGRFETLEAVVRYYAEGCGPDEHKSDKLKTFACSDQDAQDLVAFLEALSGDTRPGAATKAWAKRVHKTRLTFLDAAGEPLKKMAVKLVPVGDAVPSKHKTSDGALELVTNGLGQVRYSPGERTHMRIVLPEGVPPLDGALVPDSCKDCKIRVGVAGRMTFVVTFGKRESPPEQLVGVHTKHVPLVGHPRARTRFVRIGGVGEIDGGRVAKYEGWARTDAGHSIQLAFPGRAPEQEGRGRRKSIYAISAGAEYRVDLRPTR